MLRTVISSLILICSSSLSVERLILELFQFKNNIFLYFNNDILDLFYFIWKDTFCFNLIEFLIFQFSDFSLYKIVRIL